jgi:hypothetical protein
MMMVVVMGVGADLGGFLCSRFRGMDIEQDSRSRT